MTKLTQMTKGERELTATERIQAHKDAGGGCMYAGCANEAAFELPLLGGRFGYVCSRCRFEIRKLQKRRRR